MATIAVDFDGTIVEHRYPEIGEERPFATETLRMLIKDHHRLILWSVREGKLLQDAVDWCHERGVDFGQSTGIIRRRSEKRTTIFPARSRQTISSMTAISVGCPTGGRSIA